MASAQDGLLQEHVLVDELGLLLLLDERLLLQNLLLEHLLAELLLLQKLLLSLQLLQFLKLRILGSSRILTQGESIHVIRVPMAFIRSKLRDRLRSQLRFTGVVDPDARGKQGSLLLAHP